MGLPRDNIITEIFKIRGVLPLILTELSDAHRLKGEGGISSRPVKIASCYRLAVSRAVSRANLALVWHRPVGGWGKALPRRVLFAGTGSYRQHGYRARLLNFPAAGQSLPYGRPAAVAEPGRHPADT
jgi:hypothetical protein